MNGGGGMASVCAESGDAAAQELEVAHGGAGGLDDGPTDEGVADVEGELERIGFCVRSLPGEWHWDGVGHRAAAP